MKIQAKKFWARQISKTNATDCAFITKYDQTMNSDASDFIESEQIYLIESTTKTKLIIGCCTFGGADCEEELEQLSYWTSNDMILSNVYIDPLFRDKGLGSELLNVALTSYKYVNVFAYLMDQNLYEFYHNLGFQQINDNPYLLVKKGE